MYMCVRPLQSRYMCARAFVSLSTIFVFVFGSRWV
jgi:hypothetical protein